MMPKFDLDYVEMQSGRPTMVGGLVVTPYPALHTPETAPTMLRVESGGKVVTYTGDGEWTDALLEASDAADLLIMECYYYDKPVKMHMNYATLRAHQSELTAKAIVLTHMSEDMLRHVPDIEERCASDGMIITL